MKSGFIKKEIKMKSIILALALTISFKSEAQMMTSKDGYVFCVTREHLQRFYRARVNRDIRSMDAILASGMCAPLKGGLQVTLVRNFLTEGSVQFMFMGETFFASTSAFR